MTGYVILSLSKDEGCTNNYVVMYKLNARLNQDSRDAGKDKNPAILDRINKINRIPPHPWLMLSE
jgi:hypothetical protein